MLCREEFIDFLKRNWFLFFLTLARTGGCYSKEVTVNINDTISQAAVCMHTVLLFTRTHLLMICGPLWQGSHFIWWTIIKQLSEKETNWKTDFIILSFPSFFINSFFDPSPSVLSGLTVLFRHWQVEPFKSHVQIFADYFLQIGSTLNRLNGEYL